jgi:hypothetical protein
LSLPIIGSRSVTQDLYTHALRSAYIGGYRVLDPNYSQAKDPDFYEKMMRDPVIAHAINTRLHAVAGKTWRITPFSDDPNDKLVAKMCESAFKQIKRFTEARRELAAAIIKGKSFGFIEGRRKLRSLANTPVREWWMPTFINDVDHRRFRLMSHWTNGQKADNRSLDVNWEMFSLTDTTNAGWQAIKRPELFIKVIYNDEEARLGYGRGLCEPVYFYKWVKDRILEEGIQGVAKWARGTVVVNIDDARMGSAGAADDRSLDAAKEAMSTAISEMLTKHALIMGKEDKIELIESSGTGHQIVMDIIRYLDGALVSLICGSQLPFGGGEDVGSNARAETELDVHESLIQFDREKVDEDITESLVGLFFNMNAANFAELGLGGAQMPRFETVQEKKQDAEKNARVITALKQAGIDLRKDEVYQKVEYTVPQADDDVIKGSEAPQNPFGSPFDSGEFDSAMGDPKTAAMARVMMKAGATPTEAVRCAVEAGRARTSPIAPPPSPQPITVTNNIAAANPAPVQAAAPANVTNSFHLPESIKLEAMNPKVPDVIVNVPKPDPVIVNFTAPAPIVNVAAPEVHVDVAAPVVNYEPPDITINPTFTLPELNIKLELPPTKRHADFTFDKKTGLITGMDSETRAA